MRAAAALYGFFARGMGLALLAVAALLPVAARAQTFAYVANFGDNTVSGYKVDPVTGALTIGHDPGTVTTVFDVNQKSTASDDPTSDPGNNVIVSRTPMPALGISAFLKLVLPDPFEFAEQVKPKVAPAAEPSLAPVPVNPQRVK